MKSSTKSSQPLSKTVSKPGKSIRLNRFLADCGLGSRRKTEELISSGLISVNGQICKDLSCQIDPDSDEVRYEDKILAREDKKLYLMLNKPMGYVTSRSDEYGRKTVYDLLPEHLANLPYAGRLDKNSQGLLLFTNDGVLIKQLTHPSHKVEKSYRVAIDRKLSRSALKQLREGVMIEGGMTQSAGVYVKSENEKEMYLKIVIREGRKRQIRQMIEAVGAKVVSLRRLQFGSLLLKDLPVGRWRPLSRSEITALYYDAGFKERDASGAVSFSKPAPVMALSKPPQKTPEAKPVIALSKAPQNTPEPAPVLALSKPPQKTPEAAPVLALSKPPQKPLETTKRAPKRAVTRRKKA